MILRIQKQFIAAIAAAAIAITGFSAAPARAGDDEAAAAIAAILGLAVIGAVIADKRKDKKHRESVIVHPRPPKPVPPRVGRKLLPQHCLRSFRTDRGHRQIFGQRCLHRSYDHVHSLPRKCHREFYTDRGWRQGYAARCLDRHGYQLARR
ncbi:hypothetical protein [Tateyamaria sp. SN6-1]|uniref:hypothetical protein n=1 Tax=Tateyamaria sp. SN6-1 TaxID=3092148 RepID=UPI0039F5253A